ncbi:MAG TPA: DUF3185 family protein [Candidatus Didemnitutus sp.]|jgi:uncharacterized protein involved in exopolysaccharide biosynthesis
MNRVVSLAILVVGVVLLIFGINAHDAIASTAKQAITGTPTEKSMWLIVGGVAGIVVGGLGAMFRGNS